MPALGDFPDISISAPRSASCTTDHLAAAPLRLDRPCSSWFRNLLTTAGPAARPPGPAGARRMSMVIIRMNIFAVNEQVERPGIGAATARLLTERGTKVLMADVQDERGKAWH